MKNMFNKCIAFAGVLLSVVFWTSCQDPMDYYETTGSLKGSIYKTLEDRGNYTIFLKGADIAGYTPMLKGKGVWTVMAPNDEAFAEYLKSEYGVESIESVDVAELKKLIGFHIMYYSFDKNKLLNFRPLEGDGATPEELLVNAGLYYKHRTKSQDAVEQLDDTLAIYHQERFLPVFSYRMFQTKQIDAKRNYEYFYPDAKWSDPVGFNVSNAEVEEYEIITSTGYVYLIDKVLKPLETIYTELEKDGNFSTYLSLYNEYEYYTLNEELTREYGNGKNLYLHEHNTLPSIDTEWPVSSYSMVDALSSISYSIFAPTDDAFNTFYSEYFGVEGTGYPSYVAWDSIPQDVMTYLLANSCYASSMVFPEEIERGDIESSLGTVIKFDTEAVPQENRKMCVNGVLYGCDELTPPSMLGSVTGPAFQYKKFNNFLRMISNSSMMPDPLCVDNARFIMLYPSDTQMANNQITWDPNKGSNGSLVLGTSGISTSNQQKYVYAHAASVDGVTTTIDELPTTGTAVIPTLSPDYKLYWYVKDGKITNSFQFNQLISYTGNPITENDIYCEFEELTFQGEGWSNGRCYSYDGARAKVLFEGSLSNALYSKFVPMMLTYRNDEATLFGAFIQLLVKSGLVDVDAQEMILMTESCLMLVPTSSSLKEAIVAGKVPGVTTTATADMSTLDFFNAVTVTDEALLQKYLKLYFVPISTAVFSNYPFLGWGEDTESLGGLITLDAEDKMVNGVMKTVATCINIYDDGTKLSVKVDDRTVSLDSGITYNGEVDFVGDYDYFPFVFDDGCVQFIDGVL